MFRLAGAGRDRLRPRPGRPVRHPRCRKHRRFFSSRQRRVRRGAVRHAAGGGARAFPVRGHSGHPGRTSAADGKPVAESALDRRPRSAVRGSAAGDRAQARPGCPGAARRSGQHPRLRQPSATRIGSARTADPERMDCSSWVPSTRWRPGSSSSSTGFRRPASRPAALRAAGHSRRSLQPRGSESDMIDWLFGIPSAPSLRGRLRDSHHRLRASRCGGLRRAPTTRGSSVGTRMPPHRGSRAPPDGSDSVHGAQRTGRGNPTRHAPAVDIAAVHGGTRASGRKTWG